jgi:hypothetical protein
MSKVTYKIGGMNNVDDPAEVGRPADSRALVFTEGVLMVNVDPGPVTTLRPGYSVALPGAHHSGWSDPYNGTPAEAYFVTGTLLNRLNSDGTVTAVKFDLIPDIPVAFCQVNEAVAYSNGIQFGVIEDGADTAPFFPTDQFKERMVAGKMMEWFNGRLYALVDNPPGVVGCALICSDSLDVPGGIESMDTRQNVVDVFEGAGAMLQRVDDGLFVGTDLETFFLGMSDAVLNGGLQTQVSVAPYGVIPGTCRPIKGELLGKSGNCCLWYSQRGVCLGTTGGGFINITQDKVSIPTGERGTALIWEKNGKVMYRAVMEGSGEAYNPFGSRNLNDDVAEDYA